MKTANDPRQSNSTSPAKNPASFGDRGLYREVIALAKSLGYQDWELFEAVDCSGLATTLGFLQREAERCRGWWSRPSRVGRVRQRRSANRGDQFDGARRGINILPLTSAARFRNSGSGLF